MGREPAGLPVVGGGDHLDPCRAHRWASISDVERAQLPEQRRVVGGVDRRVRRRRIVGDRRVGLPVQQERGEHEQRAPTPARGAGERTGGDRPGRERAEAIGVAADRRWQHVGADERERVQRRADTQQALRSLRSVGFDQHADSEHSRQLRVEGGGHERLRAAFREREREQHDRSERRDRQRARPRAPRAGERPCQEREREERAGNGAGERRQHAQRQRGRKKRAPRRQHRAEADRQAEVERDAAGEQCDGGADGEPRGGDTRRARGEAAVDQAGEQRGGDDHRDRRQRLRSDQRSQRGRKHGVGEQVVPAVPRVIPQREARAREQAAAVARRGQVGAGGRDDQVGERERGRDRPRGDAAREPDQVRRTARLRVGALHGSEGAHAALRKSTTRSSTSGRSSHGQCPASGSSSSSARGSACA